MNKKLIAMAIAGALAAPMVTQAAEMSDVKASGCRQFRLGYHAN